MCTLRGTREAASRCSVGDTVHGAVRPWGHTVACNDHPPGTASIATWFGFGLWPIEEEAVWGWRVGRGGAYSGRREIGRTRMG